MNKQYQNIFFIISGVLIVLRALFISNTLLIDDEAYYAMYARHLSWGSVSYTHLTLPTNREV